MEMCLIWLDESFMLFPTSGTVYIWRTPISNSETRGRFCDGSCSSIVVQYSVGPIITVHGWITARKYVDRLGNQVHPMIQMLLPNNDAVFPDNSGPHSHSWNCVVQSCFEEHEGALQHLPWPAQSLYLNIIESLCSVLETKVRNRFPPPASLKATWRCSSRRMV
jgi:hypothetical protein